MSDIEDVFGGSEDQTEEQSKAQTDASPAEDAESKTSVVTERTEEVIPGESEKMVTETIDEDGDVVEETTEVTRKTVKRTMKITEVSLEYILDLDLRKNTGKIPTCWATQSTKTCQNNLCTYMRNIISVSLWVCLCVCVRVCVRLSKLFIWPPKSGKSSHTLYDYCATLRST